MRSRAKSDHLEGSSKFALYQKLCNMLYSHSLHHDRTTSLPAGARPMSPCLPLRIEPFTCPKDGRPTAKRRRICTVVAEAKAEADVEIPTRLNNAPLQREVRKWFYKDVTDSILKATSAGEKRLAIKCTIPELNPEFDVFRIGTLLELVRDIATALAVDGKKVKVCVQQPMGEGIFLGLPLSLSGVRKIMERMEWGDAEDFVTLGAVGSDQIDESQFYLLIAPQNMVGQTIVTPLLDMVHTAEEQGKQIILINPILRDVPSSSNVMSVRGRKERVEFTNSFKPVYHFRLLYLSSAAMYPIMGAVRRIYEGPWQVFKRADVGKREEEYQFLEEFQTEPTPSEITPLFKAKPQKPKWKTYFNP